MIRAAYHTTFPVILIFFVTFATLAQRTEDNLLAHSQSLQPDPGFLTAPSYATHNYAPSLASGDFNGDGRPDLVVANGCPPVSIPPDLCASTPGGVRVFLTNADGTLGAARGYLSGGQGSQSVVVGDFNGDKKLDLALVNTCFSATDCSKGAVVILMGGGDGTFRPVHKYSSGGYLGTALATGDFNRDGNLDLAVVNMCTSGAGFNCSDGEVSVLFGRGDGSFKPAVSYALNWCDPAVVAVGDFNKDGIPDLVITSVCAGNKVSVLLGSPDGSFQAPQGYGSPGSFAGSVAVADLNGDGNLDLAVTNFVDAVSGGVTVLLGDGEGAFQEFSSYILGGSLWAKSVAVADVNQDNKLDLLVTTAGGLSNSSNGQVSVFLGRGDGIFQAARTFASGGIDATSVIVSDFNGDGKPDMAVANRCLAGPDCLNTANDGGVSMMLQRGGQFLAPREYTFPDCHAEGIAVGDFDGNGKRDLAVANSCFNQDSTLSVLIGKPNGTFVAGQSYSLSGRYGLPVAVGDFNRDGKLDLAIVNSCPGIDQCSLGTAGVSVLLGNGDGTFQEEKRYNFFGTIANSLAIADFNGDGILDLAVTVQNDCSGFLNCRTSVVNTLFGKGDGTFGGEQTYFSGGYFAISVAAADFDGDGKADLAVANQCRTKQECSYGVVRILLNNGDGSFHVKWPSATMPAGYSVGAITASDFNADGKADLAVVNQYMSSNFPPASVGGISVLLGHGDGTFDAAQSYSSGGVLAFAVAIADFNGDGKPDLLVANDSSSGLLLGDGMGSFQKAQLYNEGGPSLAVGDFNHDGRPDAALAGTIILLNTAPPPR